MSDKRFEQLNASTRAISTLAIALIVIIAVGAAVATVVFLTRFLPYGEVVGSGNLATEEMDFSDFSIVEVGSGFQVEIAKSSSYSVNVTADDNLFDYIEVFKTGDTLTIRLKSGYTYQSITTRAEITMPELYELELSGGTRGNVEGFSSSHEFVLVLSGGSSLDMVDMSVGDVEIDLSGGSNVDGSLTVSGDVQLILSGGSTIELEGVANDLGISASDGSHLELSDFTVHNANVNLSGGSQATVNLDGRLDADLSGGSHLLYIGEPTMGDIQMSGGSTVGEKSS